MEENFEITYQNLLNKESWISENRKQAIAGYLIDILPEFLEYHKSFTSELKKSNSRKEYSKEEPAWMSVSRTDSSSGWRLMLGFRDQHCSYRKTDPLSMGCFNCGFYIDTENSEKATVDSVAKQLKSALEYGEKSGLDFDVIEFLSDGSFLEDLSSKAREKIIREVNSLTTIKRILIETRPNIISRSPANLEKLIQLLRNDMDLEIAIGFETADEFVRTVCINKGFDRKDFEDAVKTLDSLQLKFKNRIAIQAYMLVKPAFLNTEEAIEDTVQTLIYLNSLQKVSKISIIPKLEPSTIPAGTLNTLLYSKDRDHPMHYSILNYWSVLEILARAFENESCRDIFSKIRIGERKDMGDNILLPGVYLDQNYKEKDPIDEILYSSIQEFNFHHDLSRIYNALEKLDLTSLKRWEKEELKSNSLVLNQLKKEIVCKMKEEM